MRRQTLLKAIIVSLVLLAAPAHSSARETWRRVRSQNFTLVGNTSDGDLRRLATKLEQFRYAISLVFPKARIATPTPTTVILFKDQQSFDPFKPQYKGKTRKQIAGYFQSGDDVNYIVLSREVGASNPFEVIFHEFGHFVVHNNVVNAPPWFDEGLAEFFSTFAPQSERKFRIGIPIAWHIMTLRDRDLLPLKTLLTVDRKSPYYNETDKAGIFYAQSWALVHYLMFGNGGKRQPQLLRYISQLSSGLSPEENFRQSFETDYKTMEGELRSYISKFLFPAADLPFQQQEFVKEMQSAPLTEAEACYYLGDLQARGSRLKEAEEYLQKSISLDANLAASRISLSRVRFRQQRLDEAKKLNREAITLDPKNYLGHLYYARALAEDKQYEEAVNHYKQAALLKPDAWFIHTSLAESYLGLGQDAEASKAFSAALRLNPMKPHINRDYSYTALRLARGSLASVNARLYLMRQGWRDQHSLYMVMVAHYGYRMSERSKEAAEVLEEAAARSDTSGWPFPVIDYLRGKLRMEALLALATDNDKQTEAHAYIGMDLALKGERDQALAHLRWVRENGNRNFVEYPLALSELKRLEEVSRSGDGAR